MRQVQAFRTTMENGLKIVAAAKKLKLTKSALLERIVMQGIRELK